MTPEQRRLALRILDAAEAEAVLEAARWYRDQPTEANLERWVEETEADLARIQAARVAVLQGGGE